jgi:heme/copper-type cytochrome/quinol oxidase subunit 3
MAIVPKEMVLKTIHQEEHHHCHNENAYRFSLIFLALLVSELLFFSVTSLLLVPFYITEASKPPVDSIFASISI